MNDDLDRRIARLASIAAHPALARLDEAILPEIAAGRARDIEARRLGIIATACALAIGFAGSALAPSPAIASHDALSEAALAPSTLLAGS